MDTRRKTIPSILFTGLLLAILLVPLAQRAGNLRRLYYDGWGLNSYRWILNNIRFDLGDEVFDNGLIVNRSWAVYGLEKSLEEYQRIDVLSDDDLKTIQEKLDAESERFAALGVRTLVVVPPNKNTIYPERVPANLVPVIGSQSNLDRFLAYMGAHGQTPVLDLRPALLAEKANAQVYYATDTHWTPHGAYTGYREIMNTLGQWFPGEMAVPESAVTYESTGLGSGNLFKGLGLDEPVEPIYQEAPGQVRSGEIISWGNHHWYSKNLDRELRVAVYHDSFGDLLIPLFAETFREAHYYLDRQFNIDPRWLQKWKPDVVIIELTELYIKNLTAEGALGTNQVP